MRRTRCALAVFLCLLLCCTACGSGNGSVSVSAPTGTTKETAGEPTERELFAMDTYMTLRVWGSEAEDALDAAER